VEEKSKGRVLVIDDEPEVRRNLVVGLTQENYSVVACPDGISAVHELHVSQQKGIVFNYLVTDIFMPDIDGLKILKVIKSRYPDLPVLVITAFGDERLKMTALSELNTGYLDKPFEISDLVRAMEEMQPGTTSTDTHSAGPAETAGAYIRESISAYLTVRITDSSKSMEIFDAIYHMEGVQSCDAVRGDMDIVVLAQASSQAAIDTLFGRIRSLDGVEVQSVSRVEMPKLDRPVNEFIDVYRQAVKQHARDNRHGQIGTTSYIIVDIDKNAIQKIFTTVFFIDEVLFCDVIDGGTKLVGMILSQAGVGKTPYIIKKLKEIDGVLRVKEAKIIKLYED
jgi:CheY-like chemotaxis protein